MRRETQIGQPTITRRRVLTLFGLLGGLVVVGCGRKKAPEFPPGATYPATYPYVAPSANRTVAPASDETGPDETGTASQRGRLGPNDTLTLDPSRPVVK